MTQHQVPTPPAGAATEDDFDARRIKDAPLRMRRSRTDRKVAGVCGGFAQYARIDPVVVRVVVAALTVVGGVGVVLYAAGWLLVPEEGSEQAIVDRHHRRGRQDDVRRLGWLVAAVLVCAAVLSSGPWFGPGVWWGGWPLWPLLVLVGVGWFVFVRPDRPVTPTPPEHDAPGPDAAGALATVTAALALVVVGVLWLVERTGNELDPPAYLAAVVAVIGLGTLIGTWVGNGRRLVPLGVLAALVLAASTQVPVWSAGEYDDAPTRAAAVPSTFQVGAGRIRLDLTGVKDLEQLDGRTLRVDIGAGEVRILVPEELGVEVDASLLLGELRVLQRASGGFDNDLRVSDSGTGGHVLRLELAGSAGQIEVTRP
ncbi:MAG: PspC domain-containing protein [Actinomycetota bacterium]|nr:PspC domain-containing protein [Actinomycetota bacterium]